MTITVGAGGSLSSGAPSTPEVDKRFREAIRRFDGRLTERLHLVAARDKAAAIQDAFADMEPYIGYRCVARLGRNRRIIVLDLNWDPMVAAACARLGVPHATVVLSDPNTWAAAATLPAEHGVLVVHVHGDLDGPARSPADVRWPTPDALRWLSSQHAGGRRLVIGTTLVEDPEMMAIHDVLDNGEVGTTWAFFRGPELSSAPAVAERYGQLRANQPVFVQGPIDFDHVLAVVMDEAVGAPWAELPRHLALPKLEDLVLPRPATFRHQLDRDVVVLAGDAGLGKTTVAHLLAYLRCAWLGEGEVRSFDGPDHAVAAIGAPDHGGDAGVFVLENPVLAGSSATAFYDRLDDWRAAAAAPLIVTTRLSAWDPNRSPVVDCSPADWYDIADLQRFAALIKPTDTAVAGRVIAGWLDTPGRILAEVGGLALTRATGSDREIEEVTERRQLLDRHESLAILAALARVQELAGQPPAAATLDGLAGYPIGPARRLMLVTYQWEKTDLIRLRHQFDRDAVDLWMRDNSDTMETVVSMADCPVSLADGWQGWRLVEDAREDRWDAVAARDATTRAQHAAQLLDAVPSSDAIAVIADGDFDCWSAQDLAYTLVRRWPDLRAPDRRRLLVDLLDNRSIDGTYAVLEACLYLRSSAAREVWDEVGSALWGAIDAGDAWQCALALDGFAWRPPSGTFDTVAWSTEAHRRLPDLAGALAVLGAYHRSGIDSIGLTSHLELNCGRGLDEAAAALASRLVRWHFRHQSRARAQLARQDWVDKDFLCRSFAPRAADTDDRFVYWLLRELIEAGEPGWAVQAAMFLDGGMGIPLGESCRQLVRAAFDAAAPRDLGSVAAVCTYPLAAAEVLGGDLRRWSAGLANRDAVLDALTHGVSVDGDALRTPRFAFCHAPAELLERTGIRFPRLAAVTDVVPLDLLAANVDWCITTAVGGGTFSLEEGAELARLTRAGDLRLLEDGVAACDADAVDLDSVVAQACTAIRLLRSR